MLKFRLEERAKSPYWLIIVSPFIAIIVAIILAGILIILAGANPFDSYYQLIIGAFGSKNSFAETLARATPIILTDRSRRPIIFRGIGDNFFWYWISCLTKYTYDPLFVYYGGACWRLTPFTFGTFETLL